MDGSTSPLFVLAAFAGGFVSGFSGFAMGLVVSGVWLHIITPMQTAALIAGYGLLTQGYGILQSCVRHWTGKKSWPLVLGTTIGIPIGVILLNHINPVSSAVRCWCPARALHGLRPGAASVQADENSSPVPTSALASSTASVGGLHRAWWHRVDHLLSMARLDEGCATGGVSQPVLFAAFVVISHFDGHHWRLHAGNPQAVWAGASRSCSPACGAASSSMERSTTRHSARWCWCFSCSRAYR